LQGTVLPVTRAADVQVQVAGLDLRVLQPYVGEIWQLEITGGALAATGRVQYAAAGPAAPLAQFAGDLGVVNFTSVDAVAREDFLQLQSLTLTGLAVCYLPHRLDIAVVTVDGLRSRVVIHADKTANWNGLLKNAAKLHALIVKLQLNQLIPFQIGMVAVTNGVVGFSDQSVRPNVTAEIQSVAGCVTGLSSTAPATATVGLHGTMDGHSPFTLAGTIHPLADDLKLDLVFSLKNGEMTPGSSYAAKYVGYPIHQGQLSIEAHYTVNQSVLKAENKVRLQQLRLGAKSNSPDATTLPVKLAIALLQDRDGVLTLDVPVTGQLNNPQFQLGPVITQVFKSFITKAVSNPFAFLGALVGGGEQLSFVKFEPGRADFAAGEAQKLDTLAKALAARPALELEITGAIDPLGDRVALATSRLHLQLTARQIAELAATDNTVVPSDLIPIPPQDNERRLARLYVEVVGRDPVGIPEPPGPQQNFGPRIPVGQGLSQLPRLVTKAFAELTLADMEAILIAQTVVTAADFNALMQTRAARVQRYLLQTGLVAAERMFIVVPKPVDAAYQGQSRVNLSLQ